MSNIVRHLFPKCFMETPQMKTERLLGYSMATAVAQAKVTSYVQRTHLQDTQKHQAIKVTKKSLECGNESSLRSHPKQSIRCNALWLVNEGLGGGTGAG